MVLRRVLACAALLTASAAQDTELQSLVDDAIFVETFEGLESLEDSRWVKSVDEKYLDQDPILQEYVNETKHGIPSNTGLVLNAQAKHYGLGVPLPETVQVDDNHQELVVQFEVKLQAELTCGGAYIKLLPPHIDVSHLNADSPFSIMFGPDKCGGQKHVHFILKPTNPVTRELEEKHLAPKPPMTPDSVSHLYTAILRDNNTYVVSIDGEEVKSGSLLSDFDPPMLPPKEIDDPSDVKPEDWVEDKEIVDADARKPEDWDEDAPKFIPDESASKPEGWLDGEPAFIPDPSYLKPEDWDDEEDGEWTAPLVRNPKCERVPGCGQWERPTVSNPDYKGPWYPPMIPNPAYVGEWTPRKIANPSYYEKSNVARVDPIGAIGIEVWTMSSGITFDNFYVGYDATKAQAFGDKTWKPKHAMEMKLQDEVMEERRMRKEGGFVNSIRLWYKDALTYAHKDPTLVGGAAILVSTLLVLLLFTCRAPHRKEKEE